MGHAVGAYIYGSILLVWRRRGQRGPARAAKLTGTGRRGHRFGTPIWPGTNNLLWIGLPDEQVAGLAKRLEALKRSYMKPPALQVFVFPVESAG
jgi:hypothetical protein